MRTQVSVAEIMDIVRGRKMFFLIPFLIISLISVIGANILPKRYESYITILFNKERTLNPLLDFQGAVRVLGGNPLASFDEIVLSRTTIQHLLDSLGRKPDQSSNEKLDDFIAATRKKISTDLLGNNGFKITFVDSDPFVCQKAATVLCNIYIQKSLQSEHQQVEETVKFLGQRVEELRLQYEAQQREFLNVRQRGLASSPIGESGLKSVLGKVQENLTDNDRALEQQQSALSHLKMFQENLDNPGIISQIAALDPQGGSILYIDSLRAASLRYNQLLTRYTPRYPQVQTYRKELSDLLTKSIESLQARIEATKAERASLGNLREKTQGDISSSINVDVIGGEWGREYRRVQDNYETAKQKLDQAKMSKELASGSASKFAILDQAEVPSSPTKPKKLLIILGGVGLGFLAGVAAMFLMEYYDPTIRRRQDIEVFNKPIIAYLP